MRSNNLTHIMESVANGQMEQAVEFILIGCKSKPSKLLAKFHTLLTTEEGDRKDIIRLMEATAKELAK